MRKTSLVISAIVLVTALFIGLAPAVSGAANTDMAILKKDGEFGGIVVFCGSEDIVVKQEGKAFKVALDGGSVGNYRIRDNRGVPMSERYFYYNKWDIIFERADRYDDTASYASSITITVPEEMESLLLRTDSGNIQADGLRGLSLDVESASGDIAITGCVNKYTTARSRGRIELCEITATEEIIVNNKSYKGSDCLKNGAYTVVVEGCKKQ